MKDFITIFVKNNWSNFHITWQKCSFGDPLSRFSSSCHDALKKEKMGVVGYKIESSELG